jgi:hypothetical protein
MILYFQRDRSPNWLDGLLEITGNIAQTIGVLPTHLDYSYHENRQGHKLQKTKGHIFSAKNVEKLKLDVSSGLDLCGVSFEHRPIPQKANLSDVAVRYSPTTTRLYKIIDVEIARDLLGRLTTSAQRDFLNNQLVLIDNIIDVQYGLITIMDEMQNPGIYFSDFGVKPMSQEENLNLGMWVKKEMRQSYETKLRAVYKCNLLGLGHISAIENFPNFMNALRAIVGDDDVVQMPSGKAIFWQPESEQRQLELKKLLDKHQLLLHPDGTEYMNPRLLR